MITKEITTTIIKGTIKETIKKAAMAAKIKEVKKINDNYNE